jgi:aerobic-type carbon monoxide dehydrogenase small subunit (CoxS/CutS family)
MLTRLQESFVATGAVQCGYCTPGMIMSAEALLRANGNPDNDQIRHALAGNICRCTGFDSVVRAIAAEVARQRDSQS